MGGTDLIEQHCQPMERGTAPLDTAAISRLSQQLHGDWQVDADGQRISRSCKFKNYYHTMAFVNALAWVAHQEDHHPDIEVSYNRCVVHFSTHSVGGLSPNDFICAAKIDALLPVPE